MGEGLSPTLLVPRHLPRAITCFPAGASPTRLDSLCLCGGAHRAIPARSSVQSFLSFVVVGVILRPTRGGVWPRIPAAQICEARAGQSHPSSLCVHPRSTALQPTSPGQQGSLLRARLHAMCVLAVRCDIGRDTAAHAPPTSAFPEVLPICLVRRKMSVLAGLRAAVLGAVLTALHLCLMLLSGQVVPAWASPALEQGVPCPAQPLSGGVSRSWNPGSYVSTSCEPAFHRLFPGPCPGLLGETDVGQSEAPKGLALSSGVSSSSVH